MPGVGPESIPRKREAGSPTPIPDSCAGIDARLPAPCFKLPTGVA
ncbi:TPA: cytidine deaminase [Pseudomonas aeruginosa]|nr:cytidine deaminase [Pseudomonas aeruginosa]